jgi:putative nucleotidyltransferase-like protein
MHGDVDRAALAKTWAALNVAGLAALTEYEGCVLWLHRRLKELRLLDTAPVAFARWLSARAHHLEARNLQVDAQRDDLVAILNEWRVPHVLLKGGALRLIADRFHYVADRTTTDVDVLVPAERALPTWQHLRRAGFRSAHGQGMDYTAHFHLPPLSNGRVVKVELHTSTSLGLPPEVAWRRVDTTARVVRCTGGLTRVPAATELLWHAIAHAPLPQPDAFRIRYLQDATVGWAAGGEIDWGEITARFASHELPDRALARLWLGTAARLIGPGGAPGPLGPLPALDLSRALCWRLAVFRLLVTRDQHQTPSVWGTDSLSRSRRLLIDEAIRTELSLSPSPPQGTAPLHRAGRRVAAGTARLWYETWRLFRHS